MLHIHIHIYVHIHVHAHAHAHIHTHIYRLHIRTHIDRYIDSDGAYTFTFTNASTFTFTCTFTYTPITYTHTYRPIHRFRWCKRGRRCNRLGGQDPGRAWGGDRGCGVAVGVEECAGARRCGVYGCWQCLIRSGSGSRLCAGVCVCRVRQCLV